MARFSLSFTVSGKPSLPDAIPDYIEEVHTRAEGLIAAAVEDYTDNFSVQGSQSSVTESLAKVEGGILDKLTDGIEAASSAIDEVRDRQEVMLDTIDKITSVADQLQAAKSGIYAILRYPDVFAARVSAALAIIADLLTPGEALNRLRKIADINTSQTPLGIHSAKLEAETILKKRIAHLVQIISLAEQSEIIASTIAINPETAKEILTDYVSAVDAHLTEDTISEDTVLSALRELEAATGNAVFDAIKKLPETKNITLAQTLPALVVAYNLYADIDRAGEVAERNGIRAPGFVPAGTQLSVLVR
jgi:prophage DNA circulation protein